MTPPANNDGREVGVGGPVALSNFEALLNFVERRFAAQTSYDEMQDRLDRQLFPARLVPAGMGWEREAA